VSLEDLTLQTNTMSTVET